MKRIICMVTVVLLILGLYACGNKQEVSEKMYSSPEDITVESIINMTRPQIMLDRAGAFRMDIRDNDPFNGGANTSTNSFICKETGDLIEFNQLIDYGDGAYSYVYFDSDPNDLSMYYESVDGAQVMEMSENDLNQIMTQSMFGLENYNCEINEAGKAVNGDYIATVDCYSNDQDKNHIVTLTITMDPNTGYVSSAEGLYYNSSDENSGATEISFTYSASIQINSEPKELAMAQ